MRGALRGSVVLVVFASWPGSVAARSDEPPAAAHTNTYKLQVVLMGLVGLAPNGKGVDYGKPMTTGSVEEVVALFPRAGDGGVLSGVSVPDKLEFLGRKGKDHPAHYLHFRIPAQSLGYSGGGVVHFPLPIPDPGHSYTLKFNGQVVPMGATKAEYRDFDQVQALKTNETATDFVGLDDQSLSCPGRVTGLMTFGAGWQLQPDDGENGDLVRMPCWKALVSHCGAPKSVPQSMSRRALGVLATLDGQNANQILLEVWDAKDLILSLPLKAPSAGTDLVIAVGHSQFSELFKGHDMGPEHHHFNLYHLLAAKITRPYFYPRRGSHEAHAGLGAHPQPRAYAELRNYPYCTPLAQVVRK
jgi:hypothetical protein